MTLINCRECNKEITSKLHKCIHCGIGTPDGKKHEKNKKTLKIIGGIFAALILIGMFTPEEQNAPSQPPTPQQQQQKKLESAFHYWDGSHMDLTKRIKQSMNDPSSYEHIETRFEKNSDGKTLTVATKFRGKNGFGGVVIQYVTAKTDIATGKVIEIIAQE